MALTLLSFAQRMYDLHRTVTEHNWTRAWGWLHDTTQLDDIEKLAALLTLR
jgi:hypothetical protein